MVSFHHRLTPATGSTTCSLGFFFNSAPPKMDVDMDITPWRRVMNPAPAFSIQLVKRSIWTKLHYAHHPHIEKITRDFAPLLKLLECTLSEFCLGGQMDDLSSEFGVWGFKPPLTKLKSMGWVGNALYVGIWKGKSSGHWWLSHGYNQIITKPSCFCLGSVELLIWLSLAHFTSLWTNVYIVYSDSSGELM